MTGVPLSRIASYGLLTDPPRAPLAIGDDELDRLVPDVERHRLVGTLAEAVRSADVEVSAAGFERIADMHESWARQVLRVERLVLAATAALDRHGIPYRLLKGASLARTVYPDPAQRLYVDVDLIVPADRLDDAVVAISDSTDGTRTLPELRPGHDEEFGKEITIRAGDSEIDLHRTFVTGPIGLTIPLDELFADGGSVEIGGRQIDVLAPLHQFVHACINAAVGDRPTRLQSLRDVALTARATDPDPIEVERLARRWRCQAAVRRAVIEAHDVLGLDPTPLSEWARSIRPGPIDRLLLRSYLTPARSYTRPLAAVAVIDGVRPRLRYLRAIVLPGRDYLAARNTNRTGHARRAMASIARWRR